MQIVKYKVYKLKEFGSVGKKQLIANSSKKQVCAYEHDGQGKVVNGAEEEQEYTRTDEAEAGHHPSHRQHRPLLCYQCVSKMTSN